MFEISSTSVQYFTRNNEKEKNRSPEQFRFFGNGIARVIGEVLEKHASSLLYKNIVRVIKMYDFFFTFFYYTFFTFIIGQGNRMVGPFSVVHTILEIRGWCYLQNRKSSETCNQMVGPFFGIRPISESEGVVSPKYLIFRNVQIVGSFFVVFPIFETGEWGGLPKIINSLERAPKWLGQDF